LHIHTQERGKDPHAGCEVLAARLERNDALRPAEATLVARVPPDRLDAFLARVRA
jgi:hypothetical protein